MDRPNDSELKVLDVLWKTGDAPARTLADALQKQTGWNKNTTYTLLKRLMDKALIERIEPGFVCRALVTRSQVQQAEAGEFVDKLFDGSASMLLTALMNSKKLPDKEIAQLRQLIDDLK